jgi:hypothetical protein
LKETTVKITVVKKGDANVKPMAACPWIIDEPWVAKSN